MKVLFKYFKEEDDVEILVLIDGTMGELEDIERAICEELEEQYEHIELINNDDILLYDLEDEMSILEAVDEDEAQDYHLCAAIYDKKRYALKSLKYVLDERAEENDKQ